MDEGLIGTAHLNYIRREYELIFERNVYERYIDQVVQEMTRYIESTKTLYKDYMQ